jgi:hypothetical protein
MTEQKYTIVYTDTDKTERPANFYVQARSIHKDITQKNKPNLKKFAYFFQKWKQYPDVWTWYHQALKKNNRKEEAKECVNEIIELFPDYFYGKLLLANQYIDEENAEKAREILGTQPDISLMQPNQTAFFYEDILKYYASYVQIELLLDNIDAAELILEKAKTEIKKENKIVNILEKEIFAYRMSHLAKLMEKRKSLERTPTSIHKNIPEDYSPTPFQHIEVQDIYEGKFNPVKKEEIDKILSLPRESLIGDLEEIIRRTMYEDEENLEKIDQDAVISSIFFLTELKAIESKDVLLQMLRQDEDYMNMWFGDFHEIFQHLAYLLVLNYPQEMKEYVKEPNLYAFFKSTIFDAQELLVHFHPEKRDSVLDWFRDILEFYYQERNNENIIDTILLGLVEYVILDLKFRELLPILEKLHEKQLVDEMSCGNIEKVREEFEKENLHNTIEEFDIYKMFSKHLGELNPNDNLSKFEEQMNNYLGNNNPQSATIENHNKINNMSSMHAEKKVGRNDPCPCGSGKKYKKCCG